MVILDASLTYVDMCVKISRMPQPMQEDHTNNKNEKKLHFLNTDMYSTYCGTNLQTLLYV